MESCLTQIFEIQAADRQIPIDFLEVHVRAEHDTRAGMPVFENVPFWPHNITYAIDIESSATDDQILELHQAVEDVCPILNLLANPPSIMDTMTLYGNVNFSGLTAGVPLAVTAA